jgi:hypothetical protein
VDNKNLLILASVTAPLNFERTHGNTTHEIIATDLKYRFAISASFPREQKMGGGWATLYLSSLALSETIFAVCAERVRVLTLIFFVPVHLQPWERGTTPLAAPLRHV